MLKGRIAEIFESIQGEGLYLGDRQTFVRFFGCNLNCRFCDTKLSSFKEYEPQELVLELKSRGGNCEFISFTGGEPLLQKDFLKEVLKLTRAAGFKNYLETNGTLPEALEEIIEHLDIVAMDLKLPTSTGLSDFWQVHRKFMKIASQKELFLKTVICHSTKEEDLREAIGLLKESRVSLVLVLQPNSQEHGRELNKKMTRFKNICLEEEIVSCIIPQMHKLIGAR